MQRSEQQKSEGQAPNKERNGARLSRQHRVSMGSVATVRSALRLHFFKVHLYGIYETEIKHNDPKKLREKEKCANDLWEVCNYHRIGCKKAYMGLTRLCT